MATIFLTSSKRKAEEAAIEALYPYRQPPYPADPDRLGRGTKIMCGVVVSDSRTPWQQATDHDYNQERGEFPRVELTARPIKLPQEGRDLILSLIWYWMALYLDQESAIVAQEKLTKKAIARYEIWARRQSPNHDRWLKEQYEPMRKNGKKNGKPDKANEQAKETARQLTQFYRGEIEFRDGKMVEVEKNTTPPIPRIIPAIAHETPRQRMAKAITKAIASIPQSWDAYDNIKLPYGFYMQRKGFDEARIYHPKHKGSIPAGYLGSTWMVNPSHQMRNSLDTIEGIIKKYKLDNSTPPTEPTSQPTNQPVRKAA